MESGSGSLPIPVWIHDYITFETPRSQRDVGIHRRVTVYTIYMCTHACPRSIKYVANVTYGAYFNLIGQTRLVDPNRYRQRARSSLRVFILRELNAVECEGLEVLLRDGM